MDLVKHGIPKSKLAGSTSLQAAVGAAALYYAALSIEEVWIEEVWIVGSLIICASALCLATARERYVLNELLQV